MWIVKKRTTMKGMEMRDKSLGDGATAYSMRDMVRPKFSNVVVYYDSGHMNDGV